MGALEQFLEEFTYAGIFIALFLGGIGVPLPEEVPVLTAGVLAHEGVVRWWLALPVCVLGVLSGGTLLYWAGRHWGGVKIVFTARHVMGLRAAAFLTAGIARVPFPRFLAADLAASMLGVPISFGLAFFFTDQLERILTDVRRVERWVILLGFVVLAAFIAVRAWRRGAAVEREAADERAAAGRP